MKKIAWMMILVMLASACSCAAIADDDLNAYEAAMNGRWFCINLAQNDVKSFVYPSADAFLTAGGTGAVYLTVLNDQTGDYVSGEVTLNHNGTVLVILPLGQSTPIVYQKSAQTAFDLSSPVGEWAADDGYNAARITFLENGTGSVFSENTTIYIEWELRDQVIIIRTEVEGFEEISCPFDGNTIDCTEMGVAVFAYRE